MRKLAAILALTALVMSGCEDLLSIVGETYTVTYYANGATSGEGPSPQDLEPGSQVTVANRQTLARSGYEFDGWNTLADGSGTKRTVGETFTMPKNDVSLYAQWKATNAAQRTVTFNANGGTGTAMSPLTVAEGASATLPACAFTRADYSFQGWATSAGGSVAYANQATLTMGTANIVLYAVWIADSTDVDVIIDGQQSTTVDVIVGEAP